MRLSTRIMLAMVMLAAFTAGATGLISYWYLQGTVPPAELSPAEARAPAAGAGAAGQTQEVWRHAFVIRRASLVAGLVSVAVAVVLAVRLSRWLTRPLRQMSEAVQAFARGGSAPLPVGDAGSVGQLARAIAQMTAEIQAKTAAMAAQIEERQRAERTLAGLIAANPHAIIVTDGRREVHLVNSAAVILFGRPREDLLAHPFPYALELGRITEVEVARPDEKRAAELCVVPVEWQGSPAFLAILTDTTERKRLSAQLRQAQKMEAIGRLANGVAHDFNNLLTIIRMSMDLLSSDAIAATPRAQQLLSEIRSAGEWGASLAAQLQAFSRKSAGAATAVDLNAVVRELERLLRRLLGEDIEFATVLESDLGVVKADPSHLEQVIMNLAVNAREAMPRGGRLTIETRSVDLDEAYARLHFGVAAGPYVRLTVSDTGRGMSEEVKARIFEPFFTTKEGEQGSGLGLATVYGIVKQLGGDITVYSEPGQGTSFTIHLPRRTPGVGSTPSQPQRFEIAVGHETILLVEDNATIRHLTRLVLESCGYTVLEAEDGLKALEAVAAAPGPIDLVVTDVVMPRMDGRQLVDRLRQSQPEIRALFMSGYTDDTVVRYGVLEASAAFIQKPFSPASLANKVRAVLDELPL
ncbi:MAG TPA: ATP-binding protein [Opitutaceae bacterium]|nr:ATP-binding protein [Opitutaceae bacterium]